MIHIAGTSHYVDVEVFPLKLGHTVEFNQTGEESDNGWLMTSNILSNVSSDFGQCHFFVFTWNVCGSIRILVCSVCSLGDIYDGALVVGRHHGELLAH